MGTAPVPCYGVSMDFPIIIRQAVQTELLHELGRAVGNYFESATPGQLEWIRTNGLTGAHLPQYLPPLFAAVAPHLARFADDAIVALNHVLLREIKASALLMAPTTSIKITT